MAEPTMRERRLEIWRNLTPEQRDYDRFVAGQIPDGASWVPETDWGWNEGSDRRHYMVTGECGGCSCHINPPCWHCEQDHGDHDTDGGA